MPALLAPDFRERVLWQEQATPVAPSPGPLPSSVDVAIVGAGYCGLAVARTLVDAGRSVLVLEKEALGWGASSRNGGMVIPELKDGPATLEKKHGELGTRLYRAVNEAFDTVESLIADEGIDCDYQRTGQLYLAHHERLLPHLESMAREHQEIGEDVRFVQGDDLAREIGSTIYPGGVVIERTGGLHPARFHAGLARRALTGGALVHAHTAVRSIERRPSGFEVTTDAGIVVASRVIAATNAYADQAMPALQRRVVPIGSYIIATEPLSDDVARSVSPRNRMLVDTKNFLFYWRLTPDNRMVFGGRRSLSPATLTEVRDFLYANMVNVHPQLAETAISHVWGGKVAVTLDRLPHFGELDGVLYATGCNGSGVALNTWLGMQAADVVLGGPPPAFAELDHRTIPLWRARTLYLPLVGLWFRWGDRGFPNPQTPQTPQNP